MQPQNPVPVPPPTPINPSAPAVPYPQVPPTTAPLEIRPQDLAADLQLLEADEHLVTVVHRTVVGLIIVYLEALVTVGAIIALTLFIAPDFMENLSGTSYALFIAGVLFGVALLVLILFMATYIYRQSRLLVSDKSLIQIIQKGLFNRKISRLSMSNVQDVSADHDGILPTIFGFGTLTIETAGEEDNFTFPYCPTPDVYAARILNARQLYIQSLDTGEQAGASG